MSTPKLLEEIRKRTELPQLSVRAALGDIKAKFRTAYLNTTGLPPNYKESIKIYNELAKINIPEAQYNLGVMYFNGHGVEKDLDTAKKWFEQAAGQNLEEAISVLNNLF